MPAGDRRWDEQTLTLALILTLTLTLIRTLTLTLIVTLTVTLGGRRGDEQHNRRRTARAATWRTVLGPSATGQLGRVGGGCATGAP